MHACVCVCASVMNAIQGKYFIMIVQIKYGFFSVTIEYSNSSKL